MTLQSVRVEGREECFHNRDIHTRKHVEGSLIVDTSVRDTSGQHVNECMVAVAKQRLSPIVSAGCVASWRARSTPTTWAVPARGDAVITGFSTEMLDFVDESIPSLRTRDTECIKRGFVHMIHEVVAVDSLASKCRRKYRQAGRERRGVGRG